MRCPPTSAQPTHARGEPGPWLASRAPSALWPAPPAPASLCTGIVLYMLLAGIPPFHDASEPRLLRAIMSGKYSFADPVWKEVRCAGIAGLAVLPSPRALGSRAAHSARQGAGRLAARLPVRPAQSGSAWRAERHLGGQRPTLLPPWASGTHRRVFNMPAPAAHAAARPAAAPFLLAGQPGGQGPDPEAAGGEPSQAADVRAGTQCVCTPAVPLRDVCTLLLQWRGGSLRTQAAASAGGKAVHMPEAELPAVPATAQCVLRCLPTLLCCIVTGVSPSLR